MTEVNNLSPLTPFTLFYNLDHFYSNRYQTTNNQNNYCLNQYVEVKCLNNTIKLSTNGTIYMQFVF